MASSPLHDRRGARGPDRDGSARAPASLSATEALRQITSGTLSSHELVRACAARVAEREEEVGAWEHLELDRALETARQRDRESRPAPLRGIPVGIKDVIDTVDMPTSYGSALYRGHTPRRDAACVALLRAAGAVIVGKTACSEFAFSSPGRTANPRNLAHTPGGSSGGSAAAVADRMVPIAIGTQTAGSIIRPAAYCGVIGFKPTYGLISRAGVFPFAESLDTVGVFSRTVADARLVTSVLGRRPALSSRGRARRPRIGIYLTHDWEHAEGDTRETIRDAADRLAGAGVAVERVPLPDALAGVTEAQMTIMAFEAAQSFAHERFAGGYAGLSPALREFLEAAARRTPREYDESLKVVQRASLAVDALLARHDVLLTPSTTGRAPAGLSSTGDPLFNRMWTALGVPAIHVPTRIDSDGLPLGVQLVGAAGEDRKLLDVAELVEELIGCPP
ncbi:MAG TPA: amidase [Gaiellaceae bacterium]|nr:amidase [Gaiellaceae bacterium]